ncbi:unnamed protein product [Rotaria sordida]|uniref:Uncharacterized protein n=1 Tax=Rotaria sordida TaxID=392033 RepID=A0A814CIZ5_9BILA|nr:unnamed protein product [Rotaria sordida]CAF3929408.1 unnamed protein product [Rotaria sordida]
MSELTSSQQEPIPMMVTPGQPFQPIPMIPQYKDYSLSYSNSFKNNRIAPQQPDYNTHLRTNNSFRNPSSIQSTKAFIQPSQMYSLKQPTMNTTYPYNSNQLYYSQNKYMEDVHSGDLRQNDKSTSYCWQPLCCGLTRLTGGILFGTMIILGVISIGGLIASIILYIEDSNTNSQWKMLGIVVCSVLLITILITLCIFIYCYKHGRIANNNNKNSLATSEYNQDNGFGNANNYNLPYGTIQNISPFSTTNEDVIQVEDKQTNTETTMAPLRPRDYQRGVWPAKNAYGGLSYRSFEKPKMIDRFIQTLSNEIDQTILQRKNNAINVVPRTIIRLPENHHHHHHRQYDEEPYPSRFIEQKRQYGVVEKIIERPKGRSTEEYLEFVELAKNDGERMGNRRKTQRFNNVSIKRVKAVEEPDIVQNDLNTDHFYQ